MQSEMTDDLVESASRGCQDVDFKFGTGTAVSGSRGARELANGRGGHHSKAQSTLRVLHAEGSCQKVQTPLWFGITG